MRGQEATLLLTRLRDALWGAPEGIARGLTEAALLVDRRIVELQCEIRRRNYERRK